VAVEIGHAYAAAGAKTHLIVRNTLLSKLDADIAETFTGVFAANHDLHTGVSIEKVHRDGNCYCVVCKTSGGETETLTADALLVAAGIEPQTGGLGLEKTGITLDENGFIRVNECLETSVPGVYALGDVVGNYLYRHTANYEAKYLVQSVLTGEFSGPLQYGPVPYGIFSNPQIAGVGKTERNLQDSNVSYVSGKALYRQSTPGMARRSEHGLVKVLVEKRTRRMLGAHIVGEEATNMVHLFIALLKFQATIDDMLDMIFIHPALSEVAKDAAVDARRNL